MIAFQVLGVQVTVRSDSHEAERELEALGRALPAPEGPPLSRLALQVDPAPGGYRARRTDGGRSEEVSRGALADYLQTEVTELAATRSSEGLFHSAVLGRGARTIWLAGPSGCGKSTLAAVLLKRGFLYLSDECAPVSLESREVFPFAFPLKLRRSALALLPDLGPEIALLPGSFTARGEEVFQAAAAPDRIARGGWRVGTIYFLARAPGPATEVRPLRAGLAAMKLLGLLANRETLRERAVELVADLVEAAPAFELEVGDPRRAAALFEEGGQGRC